MPAANSLDSFGFICLNAMGRRGGVPPIMQQQIGVVQRPGVDGTGFIRLGSKGQPFQAVSVVDVDTFANAVALAASYQSLARDEAYELVWCGVNFSTAHGTRYFVVDVQPPVVERCSVSSGGLASGGQATVEAVWTLVPVHYEAPAP